MYEHPSICHLKVWNSEAGEKIRHIFDLIQFETHRTYMQSYDICHVFLLFLVSLCLVVPV